MRSGKLYIDWINSCLKGNSDETCETETHSINTLEISANLSVDIKTERRSQFVSHHKPNSSITKDRQTALANGTPKLRILEIIQQSPIAYFTKDNRYPIPGWTFSETEIQDCRPCGSEGKTTCNGCGGKGTNRCTACDISGQQNCTGCGGRGYSTYQEPHTDAHGNLTYIDRQKSCYSCTMGKIRCRTCSGSKEIRCSSGCKGSGKITCSLCSGKGSRVLETVSEDYAQVVVSGRKVLHGTETAQNFVRKNWTNMFGGKHLYDIDTKTTKSNIEMCGAVDILEMDAKAGRTKIKLIGTITTGQTIERAVYEVDPFLGIVIGLDSLGESDKASAKLLDLKGHRAVMEGIKVHGEKGKKKDRADKISVTLEKNYGSALSISDRTKLTQIIVGGINQVERLGLRRSWLRHILLTSIFTVILILIILWPTTPKLLGMNNWSDQHVETAGLIVGSLLYVPIIFSWFLVKFRARRKLVKLGLPKDIKLRHGWVFGILGPIFTFLAIAAGGLVAIILATIISIRTDWLGPEMRNETWSLVQHLGVETDFPTLSSYTTRTTVNLRKDPTVESPSIITISENTVVKSLGLPVEEWLPIKVVNKNNGAPVMGWIRSDLLKPTTPDRNK